MLLPQLLEPRPALPFIIPLLLSEQRLVLFPSHFGTLVLLSQGAEGGSKKTLPRPFDRMPGTRTPPLPAGPLPGVPCGRGVVGLR